MRTRLNATLTAGAVLLAGCGGSVSAIKEDDSGNAVARADASPSSGTKGVETSTAQTGPDTDTGPATGADSDASTGSDTSTGGSGSDGGGTWIDRTAGTAAGGLHWTDVASDSTGTHLVAVNALVEIGGTLGESEIDGDIWTSADAGATWINRTKGTQASGLAWTSVTSDSTGTYLVAVTYAVTATGPEISQVVVWTSADAGATWTERTTATDTAGYVLGPTVASDSSGTHLVLAAGDVWTSTDSGATWTDQTAGTFAAAQNWVDMASDSTGAHLVGVTLNGDIWTSSDSGSTWTNRTTGTAASGAAWQGVASDSTGAHLVAVSQPYATSAGLAGGDIWVSADSGATWANRTQGTAASGASGTLWEAVASDATGAHLVAASAHGSANDIWTSADSGMTWIDETAGTVASGQQWVAVASDATGSRIAAVSSDPPGAGACCFGDVWTN